MTLRPELCSVHTHSTFCDGKASLAEMAAAACAAGVRYFGASGHSHTDIPYDAGGVLPADAALYRREVLRLRAEYAGRMEVLLGIEWDSQSPGPVPGWAEYWIGSVHNLWDPESGTCYAVDWDREKWTECREGLFHGDVPAMIEGYYRAVAETAARKPTILGHLDLVAKFNGDGTLFDEADPRYRQSALEALHAADPADTVLEVNTGGVARGYRSAPYPALFLLREWRRMGGRILLTADAHRPEQILFGYGLAAETALTAGFRECVLLTAGGFVPCPLESSRA